MVMKTPDGKYKPTVTYTETCELTNKKFNVIHILEPTFNHPSEARHYEMIRHGG